MLATQNPVFDRAVEVQKSLSQNREIRAYYDRRLVEKTDELTQLYYATKKGLKEGLEDGLKQGRLEVARRMAQSQMPMEQISSLVGLPEDEIRKAISSAIN